MLANLIEKYRLPSYFSNWAFFNLLFIMIISTLIMVYSDGQVTVKFIQSNYNLDNQIKLYDDSKINYSIINFSGETINTLNDQGFNSFRRYYSQVKDRNHFIEKFNYYFYVLVIPLFNILYGLLLILDGSIMSWKDLNTRLNYIFRGVSNEY